MKTAALSGAAAWAAQQVSMAAATGTPVVAVDTKPTGTLVPTPADGGVVVPLAPPDKQPSNLHIPEVPPRKIGWAVVGIGELALEEILPAFKEAKLSKVVALVSGHPEKAGKVAEAYGVAPAAIYNYENFDKIANDPAIEVVYIVLPNSLHEEYTVRALKAGKHVLCEKPMAASVEEAERMVAAAQEAQRKLMIAYRLHYEPMTQTAMDLVQRRAYGAPKTFSSSNCQNTDAPNIRLSRKTGGGPLGDIGIYSINTARFILGEDPIEVSAMAFQSAEDPRFREVPESVVFTLRFPSGVLASCDCSFGSSERRHWSLHCAKGVLTMDPAFSYEGLKMHITDGGTKTQDAKKTELQIPNVNQFAKEMDHFSKCVLEGTEPLTPGPEGVMDMRIIAALEEAIATGAVVKVKR